MGRGEVLVVGASQASDDEMGQLFRSVGFATVVASHHDAVPGIVARSAPAVVAIDLELPTISGAVLVGRIREVSEVPIIVLGDDADEVDVVEAFNAGADTFVDRPIRVHEFRARVEAVLRRRLVHAAGRSGLRADVQPAPVVPVQPAPVPAVPVVAPVAAQALTPAVMHAAPALAGTVIPAPRTAPPLEANRPAPFALPTHADVWEEVGTLAVNRGAQAVAVDGHVVTLAGAEFDLLMAVIDRPGIRSKAELAAVLVGGALDGGLTAGHRAAVDRTMEALLAKLGEGTPPRWVESVPHVGYRRAWA